MSGAGGFGGGGGGGFAPGGSVVYMQPGVGGFGGATGFVGTNATYPIGGGGAGFGGAIFEYAGTLTLANDQFLNNLAVGGTGGYTNQNNGQGKGGALFIYNGAVLLNQGSIFGTGTTVNVAADAGAPGIGSSPAPYTTGATCPVEDTVDVCGAFMLPPTVSFTGPVAAVYGKTFSVTATTNSGATAAISVTGGSCQVSGTTVTMTSGTAACQLQATWPVNPPYGGATATLSVAATEAPTSVSVTGVSTATETYGSGARTTVSAALVWNANSAAAPTGGITFKSTAGGSFIGSATCGTAKGARIVCTQVFAPTVDAPGTYTTSASYAGDGNYSGSNSAPTSDFSITQQTPTVSVTGVSPASEAYGSGTAVVVTGNLGWSGAGAAPTVPAGSRLTFSSTAGGRFGPASCKGPNPIVCQATFTPTATDPVGSYTINASYAGDINYTAAQSASMANFFVTSDTPVVSLTPNPVTVSFGSTTTVKLTATFTGVGTQDAAPTGPVQFGAASGVFGGKSCTTSGDMLTCTVTYKPSGTLAVGTYSNYITTSIAAAGDYKATSGSSNLTVTQ
jgi:hypothetical protein